MKKTLIALMALGSAVMGAEEWVYATEMLGTVNKAGVHGLTFTLSAANIDVALDAETNLPINSATPAVSALPESVVLTALTFDDREDNSYNYGLLMVGGSDFTILGWSTSTVTGGDDVNDTLLFTSGNGTQGITINPATTYRFITVSQSVLDKAVAGYTYTMDKAESITVNSTQKTISGGLVVGGMACDYHQGNATTGLNFTSSASFSSTISDQSPILTSIKVVSIPEPTTATLSLLALAGLCARRRRH